MSVFDSESCGGMEQVLADHPDFGIVSCSVGQLRSMGLTVARTSSGGAGHCEVTGRKTQGVRRALAKMAEWVVRPGESIVQP